MRSATAPEVPKRSADGIANRDSLTGDLGFESISLQRGVRCELDPPHSSTFGGLGMSMMGAQIPAKTGGMLNRSVQGTVTAMQFRYNCSFGTSLRRLAMNSLPRSVTCT